MQYLGSGFFFPAHDLVLDSVWGSQRKADRGRDEFRPLDDIPTVQVNYLSRASGDYYMSTLSSGRNTHLQQAESNVRDFRPMFVSGVGSVK